MAKKQPKKRDDLLKRDVPKVNPGERYIKTPALSHFHGIHYYNDHADAVRAALEGADASTVEAVLNDYESLVTVGASITARPEQMGQALKVLDAATAATIDAPGFYAGIVVRYRFYLGILEQYRQQVQSEPDTGKRREYFAAISEPKRLTELTAAALWWIRYTGIMRGTDFAGMEQQEIAHVFDFIERFGPLCDFLQYVYFLRRGLGLDKKTGLNEIPPPPLYKDINEALAFASYYAGELAFLFDFFNDNKDENKGETQDEIIKLAPVLTTFASRGAWASQPVKKDGDDAVNIFPIKNSISDFLQRNKGLTPTTEYYMQKAADGVNLLQHLRRVLPVNGIYTLETNLSEFAGLCSLGSTDVSNEEKKQLLTGLMVLDNLFCVIWTPRGPVAQRLFTVERFGKNDLRVHVYEGALKGKPYFIRKSEILQLTGKGSSGLHFRAQILSKGHKEENALISEIFGYDTALKTGNAEQIAAAKEYQRKHVSRDRSRLQKMFDDATADGLITYTRTQNDAGECIYNWTRTAPPTVDDYNAQQEPDEQPQP